MSPGANTLPEGWFAITAHARPMANRPPLVNVTNTGRAQVWMNKIDAGVLADRSSDASRPFWMPRGFVMRLIKMGMVDNTHGWRPDEWRAANVRTAQISAKTVKTAGNVRTVMFSGPIDLLKDGKIGYTAHLAGELDIDAAQKRVTRFRAFAWGTAWGCGVGDRGERLPRYPLGIAFVETTDPTVMNLDMGSGVYGHAEEVSDLIP